MRFYGAASTGALNCLLLLLPAALGKVFYLCENQERFHPELISKYARDATTKEVETGDPTYPDGQVNKACRFIKQKERSS
ncbi:BgtAcSP-31098 [Blumeria graminis f. sp. tritici]|uniref:BgtAcSP-31098 n=2 Tax=Blumeria graminis f. sp. tritici TaxID=62690 RepID=A0A9X9L746_BLUGR|nr:hypothetical protein BGT96224_AcSP31098 [Blumeria graminis f. sp. tritici 96224]VCU38997.1 BgtAcSP-31098 [Blumeria graminis f. sp. tritici]